MSRRRSGWTLSDMPDQAGKTVVITGANSGLGLRSAEALAGAGAKVLMACRNPQKGADALEKVAGKASGPAPELVTLDLADQESVVSAAKDVAGRTDHLDVLLNNAGIMAVPLSRNANGWESQLATNHFGHFALTGRLLPLLLAADAPRVVTTSSQAHRAGGMNFDDLQWHKHYRKWRAYGRSKLANLHFAFELDRRTAAAGTPLVSAAAHPGYADTHLQTVGPEASGNKVMEGLMGLANQYFAQSAAAGALPQLYAATMLDVRGGDYFGPKGPFEQHGPPTRVKAKKAAYDRADAARLWEISESETGVAFAF